MLGAIIGDIVGSVYEFDNTKDYNFHLLTPRSKFTDDTVMTLAVAKWLTEDDSHSHEYLVKCMRELGLKYPWAGYGGNFKRWLIEREPKPYNSWGNGSDMRVSPVGFYAHSLDEALELAKVSAEVTHNHPEGIKGAQAIAAAVFLTRQGKSKEDLREYLETTFGYDLHRTIDGIRPEYSYDVSCMGSVPEAISAYLDSHDFESTIRNAVSIGGDSDTIAAMAGAVAQAAYEMPKALASYCYGLLTPTLRHVLDRFERKIGRTTDDPFNLQRFIDMQQTDYSTALQEMKNGQKQNHWIWYVFPQLRGLGHSSYSWIYGLADTEEAKAYLIHPVLGPRLREVTQAVLAHRGKDIVNVMGSSIDALKLCSSMTLFDSVSPNDVFREVLDAFFEGKGDKRSVTAIHRSER
jgi:ADP-ribosylglycohydrolase/uncharacterized protein (DUF1810 family)